MQLFSLRSALLSTVFLFALTASAATVPAAAASPASGAARSSVASPTPIHSSVDGPIKLANSGPLSATPKAGQGDNNALTITGLGGGSTQWTIVVLLTFLTLIPSILICMTPFARLLIVFHFLRQALGLQTTPSNQTLVGLSLIMTFFLMQPIANSIYKDSIVPLQEGKISAMDAIDRGSTPIRGFMSRYVRDKDVAMILDMAKQ